MAIPVLYAFLADDSLRLQGKLNFTDAASTDQGYGILSGEANNYFIKPTPIDDNRSHRLSILDNKQPYGDMRLWFDLDRFDGAVLEKLSDLDLQRLFNIIERVVLQQRYNDSNIEQMLTSEASYTGYTPNTYIHSTNIGTARMRNRDDKNLISVQFFDWYSFEFLATGDGGSADTRRAVESDDEGTEEDNRPVPFRVKFWIKRSDFQTNYPYTTITSVIPPCEPEKLVDPLGLTNSLNLDILNDSSSFILEGVHAETSARDQSGTYKFLTKYVVDNTRVTNIFFGINYCGPRIPTSLECRKAVREYLQANTSVTEEYLKTLFPELYVQARFYIAPYWSWKKELSDRIVFPSIWNVSALSTAVKKLWPDIDAEFIAAKAEIFTHAADKMLLICVPDELNERITSLRELFPTYNDWSTTSPQWRMLPPMTQDFATKTMRCLSILKGQEMSDEFLSVTIDGIHYLSFTSGEAEFLVMTEMSFNSLMNREE